jgi:hypothetical protein
MISNLHARRNERGVVLIIVLAMVLLMTGLILAYFSRTMMDRQSSNTSFNQSKADELARSSLDIITGDLKQEIANGSVVVAPVPAATNYSPIYQPTSNANMIPVQDWPGQTTIPDKIPNLIRISSTTAIPLPGADHLASAVLSTAPSGNGRSIGLARWNKHYLIPCVNSATDSTPISAPTVPGGFTAPSWVFVTTSGPAVIAAPTTTVTGRYAYAIYDEGGLLDINSAGYPSPPASTPTLFGGKGASVGYADLTQLTDSSGNPLSQQAQIDQIVGWRNNASVKPSGSFGGFNMSATSAPSYLVFLTAATNGFLKVSGTIWTVGGINKTDQAFLSRQELLNFWSTLGYSPDFLQYLGTFSREVNAPSFYYPAAGTAGLAANDPVANSTNLNILTLRMTSAGKAVDGFTWKAGDPLVCRRFPLGRLSNPLYVAYNQVNTAPLSQDPVYNFFGLYRTNTSQPWVYVGSSASPPASPPAASAIETLDQVAAETPSREPNFFELLKAAIHRDSLGVTDGFPSVGAVQTMVQHEDSIDSLSDLQIFRIGANMIDQADADSYPTVISYAPVPVSAGGVPLYAYGIEDLPYITALSFRCVSNWNGSFQDQTSAKRQLYDQIVPVLWNPHRTINAPAGSGIPASIQLWVTGETGYTLLQTINGVAQSGSNNVDDYLPYQAGTYSRNNQMGQSTTSAASWAVPPGAGQNTGSIIIDQTQLSSFANPNLILSTNPSGGANPVATGAYFYSSTSPNPTAINPNNPGNPTPKSNGGLPYHTNGQAAGGNVGILGLTLANLVYSQGRAPGTADIPNGASWFDGYNTYTPTLPAAAPAPDAQRSSNFHHALYLDPSGTGTAGLNAVLSYKDLNGNYQVYNAMASNEADPQGNVNPLYDYYGITNSAHQIYMSQFATRMFPTWTSAASNCFANQTNLNNWSSVGGTVPATSAYPYSDEGQNAILDNRSCNGNFIMKADPRTARFGLSKQTGNGTMFTGLNVTPAQTFITDSIRNPLSNANDDSTSDGYEMDYYLPASDAYNVSIKPGYVGGDQTQHYFPAMWSQNSSANGPGTYYFDNGPAGQRTGKVRPGDDYFSGLYAGTVNTANNIYQATDYTTGGAGQTPTNYDARPVVLNRPFRSVGELGYVYRDMPHKSLDMASSVSVDAALLDFFTVDAAQTPLVAGKVDLNTRQPKVLQCILNGSFRLGDPTTRNAGVVTSGPGTGNAGIVTMGPNAAATIAQSIVTATGTSPFLNKAQLVTTMANTTSTVFDSNPYSANPPAGTYPATATDTPAASPASAYPSIKSQREAPIRALADVANARTWNLLIDVIAQTGQYPPGAINLNQFIVTGERRYWLHVAIDRYTGKVVDQVLEPVYE